MAKDKLHLLAMVESSITRATPMYDISLYTTFTDWSNEINRAPHILSMVIITEDVIRFTGDNMSSLQSILNNPFLRINGKIIYVIKDAENKRVVSDFLENNMPDKDITVYVGDCSYLMLSSLMVGNTRSSEEGTKYIETYRMRAEDYAKELNAKKYSSSNEDHYVADDEEYSMADVEAPEQLIPTVHKPLVDINIVGMQPIRTYFTILLAQYAAIFGKTVIVDSDWEFHTLTDAMFRSGMKFDYYDISQFCGNAAKPLNKIKKSPYNLILIGCTQRKDFLTYNFVIELLISQLRGFISSIFIEGDLSVLPSTGEVIVVCENSAPAILKTCSLLQKEVDTDRLKFAGITTSFEGQLSLARGTFKDILREVFRKDVFCETYKMNGLNLKKGDLNDLQILLPRELVR